MAFTNPILAGEALNRTGIRSENYLPGLAGWRIATDGAAEFDNIGVRGNLWVPSITLDGQDLSTRLGTVPGGIVAWVAGYPAEATTGERQIMYTECPVVNGRWYEFGLVSLMPDISGARATEFVLRIERGSATPSNSSEVMAVTSRLNQFDLGDLRQMWGANYTGTLKLRASIHSLDGSNVRCWAPGSGAVLYAYEMGKYPAPNGSVGVGTPVKTLKEWTITANSSKTYNGDGTVRTDQYATTLVAGDWANGRGNQRSWFTFSSSDVATYINDLTGVPLADIITAELWLHPLEFYNYLTLSGYLSIGFHNTSNSLVGNEPGGGIPNVHRPTAIDRQWHYISIKSPDSPTNFLDSMRDGYLKGFMLGNTFSGPDYRVVCEGYGWDHAPRLHMKYWK